MLTLYIRVTYILQMFTYASRWMRPVTPSRPAAHRPPPRGCLRAVLPPPATAIFTDAERPGRGASLRYKQPSRKRWHFHRHVSAEVREKQQTVVLFRRPKTVLIVRNNNHLGVKWVTCAHHWPFPASVIFPGSPVSACGRFLTQDHFHGCDAIHW